jgi:hypothetical protein
LAKLSKKSPRRRRRGWVGLTARLALIGLLGIGGAVLLFPTARAAMEPFRLDDKQEIRLRALDERHARLQSLLAERRRYRNHLRTAEGHEVLARQQGFHLPGEKVYLFRSR